MTAVWEHSPATAREVLERIPPETAWAYTTVKTMLARLVGKGALAAEKRGNTSVYTPLLTRDEARRSAWGSLLDRAFEGGVGSFVRFVAERQSLSSDERAELRRMLDELDAESDSGAEPR